MNLGARAMASATVLLAAILSVTAEAQAPPRRGPFFGVSLGLGNSSPDLCNDCQTGIVFGLRGGGMLKPRLGLLGEFVSVSTAPDVPSDIRGRHNVLVAGVQYWPAERFWLKGGFGVAGVQRAEPPAYDYSTTHAAGLVGVGFEFNPRSRFVVELALLEMVSGDSPARYPGEAPHEQTVNSLTFSVGVTWHRR